MEKMVQLTEPQAYALKRLLDDIMDIDSRARCSDKFFRSHFNDMVKTAIVSGAYEELKRALEGDKNVWN